MKPIIFSGEMVKVILEGRKTQTRRPIKDPRKHFTQYNKGMSIGDIQKETELNLKPNFPCPYGQPGDRLWVRETFAIMVEEHDEYPFDIFGYAYKATDISADPDKWIPSIHMPRRASRITLEVVDVRVERVQEITEKDARAEGCISNCEKFNMKSQSIVHTSKWQFMTLWDSLYSKKPEYQWKVNPWVWVLKFKVIK